MELRGRAATSGHRYSPLRRNVREPTCSQVPPNASTVEAVEPMRRDELLLCVVHFHKRGFSNWVASSDDRLGDVVRLLDKDPATGSHSIDDMVKRSFAFGEMAQHCAGVDQIEIGRCESLGDNVVAQNFEPRAIERR